MPAMPLLLSTDQGTTSSRAVLFEKDGRCAFIAQLELKQIFPRPGWVEHDPEEIWATTLSVVRDAIAACRRMNRQIVAIGITNQRETTVIWDRHSGKPVYNAIVWQDRRTAGHCDTLKQAGHEPTVMAKTGLLLAPYFSATKIAWILDQVPDARGALLGLTRGTGIKEIIRATLESVCYQTHDLFQAMANDGVTPTRLRVDGGMVSNRWLCQFLADILELPVQRPVQTETTALGAAYLAGLQCGLFDSFQDLEQNWQLDTEFSPALAIDTREALLEGWHQAIHRVRSAP